MNWIIVNQDGGYLHRGENVATGENSRDWPTEQAAQERCAQANTDAEALGIKTRYEVRDA
jgi:hypothetical protein